VQANDWLSKLADKFYGDPLAYPAIVAATNAQSAADTSFTRIDSADVIEPGWKLCIISTEAAQAMLAAQSTQTSYPLTLFDGLGREVTLAAKPQRIISLLPSNTEVLFALGVGDRVVGVTTYDNYPPEALEKTQIGGLTVETISIETILSLEPDLILAHDENQLETINTLTDNGLTVFALNTVGIADVYRSLDWVGQLTDTQAEAETLKRQIQADIAAVNAKIEQVSADDRPTVFYEVWDDPLMSAGPNTFIGQLISLGGGSSVFSDLPDDYPLISPEVLLARNPSVILGPEQHIDPFTVETVAARPGWGEIAAVQNGRVYPLDADIISRPGPRLGQALQLIAAALYPDLFSEE
jgi:iron complex transport system substrate-binding protein